MVRQRQEEEALGDELQQGSSSGAANSAFAPRARCRRVSGSLWVQHSDRGLVHCVRPTEGVERGGDHCRASMLSSIAPLPALGRGRPATDRTKCIHRVIELIGITEAGLIAHHSAAAH